MSAINDVVPLKLLGYEFRPMEGDDFDGFAGAADGSFICEPHGTEVILIFNPATSELTEVDCEAGLEKVWQLKGVR